MDLSDSQEAEITMPISVTYGPIHESSKFKMLTAGGAAGGGIGGSALDDIRQPELSLKKAVRYRECLKNHAASIGGHAIDGCGEFMPSGEEGTLEALKCAACNCHRNFHRREVEGEASCYCFSPFKDRRRLGPMALLHNAPLALPSSPGVSRPSPQMIMALSSGPIESEDQEIGLPHASLPHPSLIHPTMSMPVMKKRFRTKFTTEQKDKMCAFAEKLGWRIQKHDETAVQQFCMDVGVKRHVLKVWMHNNKHTFGKKLVRYPESYPPESETAQSS
eukprot:c27206_g1_i1 orf=1340-2167(+)